jgi:hypothetical protein
MSVPIRSCGNPRRWGLPHEAGIGGCQRRASVNPVGQQPEAAVELGLVSNRDLVATAVQEQVLDRLMSAAWHGDLAVRNHRIERGIRQQSRLETGHPALCVVGLAGLLHEHPDPGHRRTGRDPGAVGLGSHLTDGIGELRQPRAPIHALRRGGCYLLYFLSHLLDGHRITSYL